MRLASRGWLAYFGSLRAKCRWARFISKQLRSGGSACSFNSSNYRGLNRCLRFEQAEPRVLLSVTPSFSSGVLSFTGDTVSAVDTITLAVNGSDNVTWNGNEFLGGFAASAVTEIFIETGGGNDVVNLTGVLREKFTSLTDGAIEVYGEAGNDTIYGSPFGDIIYGGDGGDTIEGRDGDDQLFGGAGVDWLKGGNGDDLLEGGVDTSNDVLQGEAGNDVLKGQGGTDTIQGNDGDDTFWVGAGSATFWGGAGADTYIFDPATGDLNTDTIRDDSGAGIDTLDFSLFSDSDVADVTASLVGDGTVQTTAANKVKFKINSGSAVENITGGEGDDTLTGNALDNMIIGGDGDDTLDGGDGNDFLSGDAGNDSLTGGDGDDTYWFDPNVGTLGSDSITEAANADSDTLDFRNFTDDLTVSLLSTSSQTVVASVLTLTLSNDSAIENIISGSGDDYLYANLRPNIIDGRDGDDNIYGYSHYGVDGDDLFYGGAGADTIQGDAGIDTIFGGDGDDFIAPGEGNDFVFGEDGDDYIFESSYYYGDGGNDYFDGGPGNDELIGGVGNDTLIGGEGDDILQGGSGNDTYLYRWYASDLSLGSDTITEAASGGSDTVDFTAFRAGDYDDPDPAVSGAQEVSEDILTLTFSTTSQVETVVDPASTLAVVSTLFVDTTTDPDFVRLIAAGVVEDPSGSIDSVSFYLDSNRNGILDGSDEFLDSDTDGSDGWSILVDKENLPEKGRLRFFAVPEGASSGNGPATAGDGPAVQMPALVGFSPIFVRLAGDANVRAWSDINAWTNVGTQVADQQWFEAQSPIYAAAGTSAAVHGEDDPDTVADGSAFEMLSGAVTGGAIFGDPLTATGGLGASGIGSSVLTTSLSNSQFGDAVTASIGTSSISSQNPDNGQLGAHSWTLQGPAGPANLARVEGFIVISWGSIGTPSPPDLFGPWFAGTMSITSPNLNVSVTDTNGNITIVQDNVQVNSTVNPDFHSVGWYFAGTVPVGGTVNLQYNFTPLPLTGIANPGGATTRVSMFTYAASLYVVGWA